MDTTHTVNVVGNSIAFCSLVGKTFYDGWVRNNYDKIQKQAGIDSEAESNAFTKKGKRLDCSNTVTFILLAISFAFLIWGSF